MNMLIMTALSVTTRDAQQTCHGCFADFSQSSGRTHTTAFDQMVDDLAGLGLRDLGVEQSRPTPLGKFFTAAPTAQQADGIVAIDFSHHQIPLPDLTKEVAFGIDTR